MKPLLCLLFLMMACPPARAADTIRIVYFNDFPPYSWAENGRMRGILVDVLQEALGGRMGLWVKHEGYPWQRAQEMVRNGLADAFTTVVTPQRLEYSKAGKATVVNVTFTLFTGRSNPRLSELMAAKSLEELKGFRFGAYLGSGWSQKNLTDHDVTWVSGMGNVLRMLTQNRVDAFIDVSRAVEFEIRKLGLQDQIEQSPHVYDSSEFKLFIGDRSSLGGILPAFDKVMDEMARDGSLERILAAYR